MSRPGCIKAEVGEVDGQPQLVCKVSIFDRVAAMPEGPAKTKAEAVLYPTLLALMNNQETEDE